MKRHTEHVHENKDKLKCDLCCFKISYNAHLGKQLARGSGIRWAAMAEDTYGSLGRSGRSK